jgi:hypothetical protein
MLAPLGAGVKEPLRFPLFLLYDFTFVRRRGTEMTLSVDGEALKPATLPMPVAGSWVYFTRYARDPFIVSWNKAFDGVLAPNRPGGPGRFLQGGVEYELVEQEGHFEIAAMGVDNGRHAATFTFTPPFPDAAGLREGASAAGAFVARGDPAAGRVEGVFAVERRGNEVRLRLHPSGGWLPNERRLSVRLVYALVGLFKRWPKTYEWNATLTLADDGQVSLRSGWRRLP